jgi:protein-tyrosine-phosphatase
LGIDITAQHSKHLDTVAHQVFDRVITVCDQAREQCPVFPSELALTHWSIEDPIAAVEKIADQDTRRSVFAKAAQQLTMRIHYLLLTESSCAAIKAAAVAVS